MLDPKMGIVVLTAQIIKYWLKYTEKCLVFINKDSLSARHCVVSSNQQFNE